MKRLLALLLPAAILVLLAGEGRADIVHLKSGKTIEGEIIEDTPEFVRIRDKEGRVIKVNRSEIEFIEESAGPKDELAKKLAEIDPTNADSLVEVAKWAAGNGLRKEARDLYRQAVDLNPDQEEARKALGHVKAGDQWFESAAKAAEYRKTALADEMKAKGYLAWKGGFIRKEDLALAQKTPSDFQKDAEGVWKHKDAIMKEKGYTLVNGKWVKAGTADDQKEMATFKSKYGDDIWASTSEHFSLYFQLPPDQVGPHSELAEKVYAWFLNEMGIPDGQKIWPRRAHLWALKNSQTFQSWLTDYQNRYGMNDDDVKFFRDSKGNFLTALLGVTNLEGFKDRLANAVAHDVSHFLVRSFVQGVKGTPAWLVEGFGNYTEQIHCQEGVVSCSTKSKYDADGSIAKKDFTTKDGKDINRANVKDDEAPRFEDLMKLGLNELNRAALAKSWSLVEWLMAKHKDKFTAWLRAMNRMDQDKALMEAFGWTPGQLDSEWEAYVKKNY